jgi:drug/metabolite transporter (DMT)-like permease
VLFLGNHLPGNSHVPGVVPAADAGNRALPAFRARSCCCSPKRRGLYLPRGRELAAACFSGFLTLGIGNGALVFSEVLIPSGIAGLIISISPFWMVGVEAFLPGGERLHAPTLGGMAVGLAGAALLFTPDPETHGINRALLSGFLMLQVGMAGWSFGSIYQRRKAGKAHPVVAGGVQQLAAALILLPFSLAIPQAPLHWSVRAASRRWVTW